MILQCKARWEMGLKPRFFWRSVLRSLKRTAIKSHKISPIAVGFNRRRKRLEREKGLQLAYRQAGPIKN